MQAGGAGMEGMEGRRPGRSGAQHSYDQIARRAAWKRQKADTQNSQLFGEQTRTIRGSTELHTQVFFANHVECLEQEVRQRDQRGILQHPKSSTIKDTWKVSSQYIRDEEGKMLRDQFHSREGGRGSSTPFSRRNLTFRPDIIVGLPIGQ